jgi:hypothetical protein
MTLTDAISALHREGYRASPSTVLPGYIRVLDPALICSPGRETRTVYDRRTIHPSQVSAFIIARS